ncbi:MAG: carnitine dehydratase [Robiginitomaculum sp.]|nr:MAG: carnitine dehydratase [Robiginitomaculum sp.]
MNNSSTHHSPSVGPLAGLNILELSGIGPIPYAGQLLSDLGASVTRIVKSGSMTLTVENRGKKQLMLDLRQDDARETILEMLKTTDILIEGSRPGVAERLGLGPDDCLAVNPKLIYGRMTGWGQDGPWAHKAGHDINYIGLSGALLAMGDADQPPVPPLNLVGDYGGGSLFLIMGILSALIARGTTGKGQIIDASIVDGTMSMLGIVHSLSHIGMWNTGRANNLLDGSRPYYRCYTTQDGGYMAAGCLEPQFYTQMLQLLGLEEHAFGGQHDSALWEVQIETLTTCFASKPRSEWEDIFDASDACVTPVLSYEEAPHHKQNKARHGENALTPPIAPKFSPQT